MRRAVSRALRRHEPRAILYSAVQSTLLQPRRRLTGAGLRYDALTADNRPGRANAVQHALERRALRRLGVLLPAARASRVPAEPRPGQHVVRLPFPIAMPDAVVAEREPLVVCYAGNPDKKGLDVIVQAWAAADPGGPAAGRHRHRAGGRAARFLRARGVDEPRRPRMGRDPGAAAARRAAGARRGVRVGVALRGLRHRTARGARGRHAARHDGVRGAVRGARDRARAGTGVRRGGQRSRPRSPRPCGRRWRCRPRRAPCTANAPASWSRPTRRRRCGGAWSRTSSRCCSGRSPEPFDRVGDALAHADPRLQPSMSRAFSVDGQRRCTSTSKRRQVLELEVGRVVAARLPDDPGDLAHGQLIRGGHVEVLADRGVVRERGRDAVRDVVDVRERAGLLARPEDRERALAPRARARSGRGRCARCPARRPASPPARTR